MLFFTSLGSTHIVTLLDGVLTFVQFLTFEHLGNSHSSEFPFAGLSSKCWFCVAFFDIPFPGSVVNLESM